MTMNLSWLEDFLALAESGNFSRAAELRHMTQPAFSRRIRALEEWIGTPLFDRSGHPVTLTEPGQWLRGTARQILERVERLPDEARAIADGSASTLRFAATHALSLSFLPPWLRRLEALTAVGPIQLVSDVAAHCEALLEQGRVQFLLCHAHDEAPVRLDAAQVLSCVVGTDELVPVVKPDDQGRALFTLGAGLPSPAAAGAARPRIPVLAYSAESGIGRVVRSLFGPALDAAGAQTLFTAHLATVLRKLALEGRGVTFVPASLVRDDLQEGRLVLAGNAGWRAALGIRLYRRIEALPPVAERFWLAASSAPAQDPRPDR
jgi:LysR family transcriptional regulator, hypochlorite-specific transcription factor HypT